jgi:hypothetical protein
MEKHRKLLRERKSKGGNKSFVYENLICQGIEDNVIKFVVSTIATEGNSRTVQMSTLSTPGCNSSATNGMVTRGDFSCVDTRRSTCENV